MTKLSTLSLRDNPLRSLPAELWGLPCLTTLILSRTNYYDLPPEAANIPTIVGLPDTRIHT